MPEKTPMDVLVCYVPVEATEQVLQALFMAGAGALGPYEGSAWVTRGRGRFTPLDGATPAVGAVGETTHLEEDRIEVAYKRELRASVVAALRLAHPYEVPAFHVIADVSKEPLK